MNIQHEQKIQMHLPRELIFPLFIETISKFSNLLNEAFSLSLPEDNFVSYFIYFLKRFIYFREREREREWENEQEGQRERGRGNPKLTPQGA